MYENGMQRSTSEAAFSDDGWSIPLSRIPLFGQREYFFCCYYTYLPTLLALYTYIAPHAIDVCIGPM